MKKLSDVLDWIGIIIGFIGTAVGAFLLFKAETELNAIKIGFLFLAAAIMFFKKR